MPFPETNPDIVGKGVKVISIASSRRKGFIADNFSVGTTILRVTGAWDLIPVHRHSDIFLKHASFDYGLNENPDDTEVVWLFLVKHNDNGALNLDLGLSLTDRAFWSSLQAWHHVGTAANAVQTIERYDPVFLDEVRHNQGEEVIDSYHVGFIGYATSTAVIVMTGAIYWDEILYQRSWPSRAGSEWAGWGAGMDGENYGQFA